MFLFFKTTPFYLLSNSGDSELMIKQLKKEYKVKQEHLKKLLEQAESIVKTFSGITYTHIKRELNKQADLLVNQALDNNKNS